MKKDKNIIEEEIPPDALKEIEEMIDKIERGELETVPEEEIFKILDS